MSEADADECLTERLSGYDPRQLTEGVTHLVARGFHQADADVLPLDDVPLEIQDLGNTVAETIRDNEDSGRQSKAGHSKQSLHRTAFDISHGDSKRMR